MTSNKRVLLLIGSPKGEKSTSASLGNYLISKLEEFGMISEKLFIHRLVNREEKLQELSQIIENVDLIILTFPLYVDSLPAPVIKAMESIKENRINLELKEKIDVSYEDIYSDDAKKKYGELTPPTLIIQDKIIVEGHVPIIKKLARDLFRVIESLNV